MPALIQNGSEAAHDYTEAIAGIQEGQIIPGMNLQKLELTDGCVMLKHSMLEKVGEFEEKLFLAENVMWDYCVRGIEHRFKLFECGAAFFFQIAEKKKDQTNKQYALPDRQILKDKWDMNYFNAIPNAELLSYITEPQETPIHALVIGCDL